MPFGSFKLRGRGPYPKTFLLKGQPAMGQKLSAPDRSPRAIKSVTEHRIPE